MPALRRNLRSVRGLGCVRLLLLSVEIGLAVLFALAFGNGANDVGKSVTALMMDQDTAAFKPRYSPLIWGGLFSGLGSILAIIISVKLFSAFTPQSFFQTTTGISFILPALVGTSSALSTHTLL